MPPFTYTAKQGPQKMVEGTVQADNYDQAVLKIMKLGITPIDVWSDGATHPPRKRILHRSTLFIKRIPSSAIRLLIRQLADLTDAGVPILQSLRMILKHTKHPALKPMVEKIYDTVKDGGNLSGALAQFPESFPRLYVNMIKSGEISGNLEVILNRLAEYIDKEHQTRSQIQSSLFYPAFMLAVGAIILFGLFTWVIPRLTTLFEDMGDALPLPTKILMGLSQVLSQFWWAVILLVTVIGIYFKQMVNTSKGRLALDRFKLKLPVFGDFFYDVEMSRFARTLGTLLGSGVVILTALDAVCAVMDNEIFRKEIERATQDVAGGGSLSSALRSSAFFREVDINMLAVGEASGHPQKSLNKLADHYERQTQRTVKTMLSLIEPLLILFLGGILGFVVIAMLLPIFKMNLIFS